MPNRKDLTELISSLSKSEKRYFRLNAERNSKGKSKQFIDLFDAIDKGKEPIRNSVNPSVANSYLYNSILHTLNNFQESSLPHKKIARLIEHGLILYKKGLANQSLKLLEKALTLAENYEDSIQIQQICTLVRSILASHKAIVKTELTIESVLDKNLKAARDAELLARLRFAQLRFQTEVSEFSSTDSLKLDELKNVLNNSAINEVDENSTIRAQVTALHIWSQYHLLAQNKEEGLEFGKRVFDLCFENQHRLYEGGPLVLGGANNYMVRCHRAKTLNEVARVLALLETLEYKDLALETKRKEVYYTHWLAHRITTEQFSEYGKLDEVEHGLDEVGSKMNQAFLMLIFCLASHFAFLNGDYRAALKWINRFLIHDNRKYLAKNIAIAELYRLLIFHKQGKLEVLEKELKAFEEREGKVEYPIITDHFIEFLHSELNQGQDHAKHVEVLRTSIQEMTNGQIEAEAFEFFPFDKWVARYLSSFK